MLVFANYQLFIDNQELVSECSIKIRIKLLSVNIIELMISMIW